MFVTSPACSVVPCVGQIETVPVTHSSRWRPQAVGVICQLWQPADPPSHTRDHLHTASQRRHQLHTTTTHPALLEGSEVQYFYRHNQFNRALGLFSLAIRIFCQFNHHFAIISSFIFIYNWSSEICVFLHMSSWLPTSVWPEFRDALQSLRVSPRCLSAAFAMILHSFCIRDTCTNNSVGFVRLDTKSCLLFRREGWGCVLLLGSGSCDLRFSEHFTWTRQNVSYSKCLLGIYMKLNQFWNVVSQQPFVYGVVPQE